MIDNHPKMATIPAPVEVTAPLTALDPDRRPRALRWLLPTSCSSSVPLDGFQQARLKLVAYH